MKRDFPVISFILTTNLPGNLVSMLFVIKPTLTALSQGLPPAVSPMCELTFKIGPVQKLAQKLLACGVGERVPDF